MNHDLDEYDSISLNRKTPHQKKNEDRLNEIYCMMSGIIEESSNKKWRYNARKDIFRMLMELYYIQKQDKDCKHKISLEMVITIGSFFGKNIVWDSKKFDLLEYVALNYEPPRENGVENGFFSNIAEEISLKNGFVHPDIDKKSDGYDHDYRKTVRDIIADPLFKGMWEFRHKQLAKTRKDGDWHKIDVKFTKKKYS